MGCVSVRPPDGTNVSNERVPLWSFALQEVWRYAAAIIVSSADAQCFAG